MAKEDKKYFTQKRIFERNPDTGEVRSRPLGNHDPENVRIEVPADEKKRLKRIIQNNLHDENLSEEDLNKVINFLNGGDAIH
tara:strand:+ start:397 stop:642 length:246 start_codon:yes stop_codon:yes gene_type:complete